VCTVQCKGAMCVYCTVYSGTLCVLYSTERHCVFIVEYREAIYVYCTV